MVHGYLMDDQRHFIALDLTCSMCDRLTLVGYSIAEVFSGLNKVSPSALWRYLQEQVF